MQVVQSYNTAISRKAPSAPLRFLESKGHICGEILDYGSGKGADNRFLTDQGYSSMEYDPHWNPTDLSGLTFDTILCTYVLNVVEKDVQTKIVESIKSLLKKDGKAYLTVRRDIKKEGLTSRGLQRNVHLDLDVLKENSSFCIYELSK